LVQKLFVGEVFKRLRMARQMTQEELAYQSDLGREFISQIERDISEPGLGSLNALAEAFEMTLAELGHEIDVYLGKR
jgi:transcriptional regulator with XRE-family HTH domain